jgi:hypothetical protein
VGEGKLTWQRSKDQRPIRDSAIPVHPISSLALPTGRKARTPKEQDRVPRGAMLAVHACTMKKGEQHRAEADDFEPSNFSHRCLCAYRLLLSTGYGTHHIDQAPARSSPILDSRMGMIRVPMRPVMTHRH